jgi:hypothetical protein
MDVVLRRQVVGIEGELAYGSRNLKHPQVSVGRTLLGGVQPFQRFEDDRGKLFSGRTQHLNSVATIR